MMDVSIIIVSYNVEPFISFCLGSVFKSETDLTYEVIVVDNCSTDSSVGVITKYFPQAQLIKNKENLGFARACNIGVSSAIGNHLLFLNPDTIIAEDTLQLLYDAYDGATGAIGPLMIDGAGYVLPESARELPTTMAGVSKLFKLPLQQRYPYYKSIAGKGLVEAPVLTGACLFIEKRKYKNVNGFDERYFMYGEDVDLSIQLLQAGLKNKCHLGATIVHFKGESTDKKSLVNNDHFYHAMQLFLEKNKPDILTGLSKKALSFGGSSLSFVRTLSYRYRALLRAFWDFSILLFLFLLIQFLWSFVKSGGWWYYGGFKYLPHYVVYALLWIVGLLFGGVYFKGFDNRLKVYKSGLFAGFVILGIYSLLPYQLRFSRMIFLLVILIAPTVLASFRKPRMRKEKFFVTDNFGDENFNVQIYKTINFTDFIREREHSSGGVFSIWQLSVRSVLDHMKNFPGRQYSFYDSFRDVFFASSDKNKNSNFQQSRWRLFLAPSQFQKRVLDFVVVLFLTPLVWCWSALRLRCFPKTWLRVLIGVKTIVGYQSKYIQETKSFVIGVAENVEEKDEIKDKILMYARDYSVLDDLYIVIFNFKKVVDRLSG